jgi:ornithine--oxo-acid transaminase
MLCINPGEHGSTFGGNPLASSVCMAALKVIVDENLSNNSYLLGEKFRSSLKSYIDKSSIVLSIRGKGLLNAIEIDNNKKNDLAWDICLKLKENGLLAKPTHGNIIRFAPPLVITEEELDKCIQIITSTLKIYEESQIEI